MSESPAIGSLEQALSAEPLLSPVLEFELRGVKVRAKFRELSQTTVDRLRCSAIQWVEDERRRRETAGKRDEDAATWRDAQVDLDSMRANRLDLLMLHAAMVDADHGGPACRLELMEKALDVDVQEFLAEKWSEFKRGIDPDSVTQEEVKAILEEGKKNDWDPVWLWMRCGFKRLSACVRYLASQPCNSQIDA